MKVFQRLASAFAAEGVSTVFGMMGDGNMYWMDELDKLGVRLMEVRHEGVGLGMADGWARVTRTPGVCTGTCGPGVSQLATALLTASRADSPLVAFVGESPTGDDESVQRLDQARFAAACETGFVRVDSPDTADAAVRKAFYLAKTESRPVMLSAPMNVQQMAFENDEPYQPSSALFLPRALHPAPDAIKQAADIVAASRKPVIIVGRGAIWSGAGDAVTRLGKRTGALIATTLRAKTWLAEEEYHVGVSGNFATRTAIQLFQEADCVIAVGASLNRYTVEQGYLYPNARFVHLDSKPHVMMAGGRSADCYVQCDARIGVEALDRALAERSVKATGYRTRDVAERLIHNYADRTEFPIEPGCVDPREVCLALDETVPADIGLFISSGAVAGFSAMLFKRPRAMVHAAYFFGCIGQMFPAAMGAVVATGKPALLVDGDASFMMHLADFDTAVRYNMPLLAVVLNDQALGSEYHKMRAHHLKAELSTIPTPDLGAFAVTFGGKGRLARSVEDVRSAAAEWIAKPGPMILDVRISRNVLSVPNRRILYARDE
ncbi:MAG: thiamine pyrophosphate-binding protein [Betaproteobacteria bacterium]|nr:thiamine pyrophosphate-binding protein [Betaproteobacteria bacterium]